MQEVGYIELSNGIKMPQIGYGVWGLGAGKVTTETVRNALECGYRYIDTAYSYGNDFYVGKAIKNSGIAREDLFISNKVWHTFQTPEQVVECCKASLKLMKQDYFDAYLIHWPAPITQENWKEINYAMWCGMETLVQEGYVRTIGTSNFLCHHLEALYECGISVEPTINQVEFHPGCYHAELLEYCRQHNIIIQGWSPLGSAKVLTSDTIQKMALKYSKTPAQICLAWSIQHHVIPIPRSSNMTRMLENRRVFEFAISEEDVSAIDIMERIGCSAFVPDVNHPI